MDIKGQRVHASPAEMLPFFATSSLWLSFFLSLRVRLGSERVGRKNKENLNQIIIEPSFRNWPSKQLSELTNWQKINAIGGESHPLSARRSLMNFLECTLVALKPLTCLYHPSDLLGCKKRRAPCALGQRVEEQLVR